MVSQEQIKQDIERYENPHTLYQYQEHKDSEEWHDCSDIEFVIRIEWDTFNFRLKRKDSVARPFNMEEAMNGAEIEVNIGFGDDWEDGVYQGKIDYSHDNDRYLVSGLDCDSSHLRMKNPKLRK